MTMRKYITGEKLLKERDVAEQEYRRLLARRADIESRTVRNEARRARFLARLDGELQEALKRVAEADQALTALASEGVR